MSREHETRLLTVAEVIDETADARSFDLAIPPALEAQFAYAAGQFCTFHTSIEGEDVARCYSMSSSPDTADPFTVTVKRVPGGRMSNWMIDELAAGDTIEVTPPAGRFVLRASDVPLVAFAGGSGITPIVSIIKTALATTSREIAIGYANRDEQSIIFADLLERLRAGSGGRLTVRHHLDSQSGLLDAPAIAAEVGDRTECDFYVCGPGPYMEVVEAGLALQGVDPARLFIERFELPGQDPGLVEASETESVVVRLDGRKHQVAYVAGDTLLETARRVGLKPPFACQAGSCATCMAFLEAGEATMRTNDALTPDEVEEGWVLTCQAVPRSREVVVDYDR